MRRFIFLFFLIFTIGCIKKGNHDIQKSLTFYTHKLKEHGDSNQVLAILECIKELTPLVEGLKDKTILIRYLDQDPKPTLLGEQNIFITAGAAGLNYLDHFEKIDKFNLVVWSGHQFYNQIITLKRFPSIMIFPKDSLDEGQIAFLETKTKLLLLDGAPHRVTQTSLMQNSAIHYQKHKKISVFKNSIVVILPGDTPDLNGVIKLFTPEDAKKLAKRITNLEGTNKPYVITNGPRTGCMDYKISAPLPENPHYLNKIDSVSEAFLDELKRLKVKNVQFFDFQFSDLPSAYHPILHEALQATCTRVHVPGESVSVITETSDLMPIIVDISTSMNSAHQQFVSALLTKRAISILDIEGYFYPSKVTFVKKSKTSAQIAADEVIKQLLQPYKSYSSLFF